MHAITLAHAADVEGWRNAARALAANGVPPEAVRWQVEGEAPGLFDDEPGAPPLAPQAQALQAPSAFLALAEQALLHRDPARFELLYRLLWRLQREPGLRRDPLDPDRLAARALAQQVRRDQYEMRAFLRFHERATPEGPQFAAWFEPQHHVLESQAGFFIGRFASQRWAIFTPLRSIAWDGHRVVAGRGTTRQEVPLHDDRQALWLTYYASIFNPARPKPRHMQSQMPRRLWHALPEGPLIAPLMAAAAPRAEAMVTQPATEPRRTRALALPALNDREAFAAALDRCRDCPHAAHATQAVPGSGPLDAPAVLVGEQPGDQEDLQGRPFVGPAGQLLDRALATARLPRERLYLTNAVKHFRFELRGKRRVHKTPAQREIEACRGWLGHELQGLSARHVVALGATAAQALLGRRVTLQSVRGHWLPLADGRQLLVTWHPAALLRMPPESRDAAFEAWVEDLREVAAAAFGVPPRGVAASD